jgi:hypothetical protein
MSKLKNESKYPLAAIFAIVVILLCSTAFVSYTERLSGLPLLEPSADDAVVIAKRSLLDGMDSSIVFVGDSSTFHGIVPSAVSAELNDTVINLGTLSSMTTAGFSEIANEAIKDDGVTTIVYGIVPKSLEVSESKAAEMGMLGRYLTAYGRHHTLYIPSINDKLDWFIKKQRINIFPAEFEGSYKKFQRKLQEHNGFYPEKSKKLAAGKARDVFQPDEFSLNGLLLMRDIVSTTNVNVYLLINPKPKGFVTSGFVKSVNDYFNAMQKKYPDIKHLTKKLEIRDDSEFGSESHLLPDHAMQYSQYVGKMLKSELERDI